jgi:hypothetical protein
VKNGATGKHAIASQSDIDESLSRIVALQIR